MKIPIVGSGKSQLALQRCKSRRAKLKNWQSGHLVERSKQCYVCFARNENKMIFLE
jgi:hypothetical protein